MFFLYAIDVFLYVMNEKINVCLVWVMYLTETWKGG